MKYSASQPKGFMLLIVIMMLAVVCLVAYQLALLSLGSLQKMAEQEKRARERWTLVALRRTVLPQVPAVLATQERQVNLAQNELQATGGAIYIRDFSEQLELNGFKIYLEARDESARLYLPGMLRHKPGREVRHLIERLQEGPRLPVQNNALERQGAVPASWRDIFGDIEGDAVPLGLATDRITLWGSGHLNVLRADEEVVSECWRQLFGHFPPRELLDARNVYPPLEWARLRERLNLRQEQLALAENWLSTHSDCFALRITLGAEPERQERYLFVADRNSQYYGFEE